MKANQMCIICHTPICHWLKNLGYVGFEFTLQLTLNCLLSLNQGLLKYYFEVKTVRLVGVQSKVYLLVL